MEPHGISFDPPIPAQSYTDHFGNICTRIVTPLGRLGVSSDNVVHDSGQPDSLAPTAGQMPVEDLPEDAAPLFETSTTFFSTRAWWRTVLAHAIPPGAVPRLLLIRRDGAPGGLFPMIRDSPAGGFCALTTPYTCLYEPLIARTEADAPNIDTRVILSEPAPVGGFVRRRIIGSRGYDLLA